MSKWQNRIVGHGVLPADQFAANPENPRRHPQKQRDAMRGSLDALGWIAPVVVNQRTGYLIDGHERVMQALEDNEPVPYIEVDLSEDEERLALASYDWITTLAEYDRDVLSELMQDIHTDSVELQAMFSEMAERTGVTLDSISWDSAFDKVPDSDRQPYQQMTFTLHDEQAELVKRALSAVPPSNDHELNDNGNGNALFHICEVFLNNHG